VRTWKKALLGLAVAIGVLGAVEIGARVGWGEPPPPPRVQRVERLKLTPRGPQLALHQRRFDAAPGDRPRVVVLGGSSVFQPPDMDHNFPRVLDRDLPHIEVLNLGSPGASSSGLATLAEQLHLLQPDAVVVYSGHNDFGNVLFGHELDTSAALELRALGTLSRSWIYCSLARARSGDRPPLHPDDQARLLTTTDTGALNGHAEALRLYRNNMRHLIDVAGAPVVLVTPTRNPWFAPSGLLSDDPDCIAVAQEIPRYARQDAPEGVQALEAACGTETALGAWLHAHEAREAGDLDAARAHFAQALRLDPLPIRAPFELDQAVRDLCAEGVCTAVDLEAEAGWLWPGEHFTDTLHFSVAGARSMAEILAPTVEQVVGARND
jgi:lysophospholipase L1-like esterase